MSACMLFEIECCLRPERMHGHLAPRYLVPGQSNLIAEVPISHGGVDVNGSQSVALNALATQAVYQRCEPVKKREPEEAQPDEDGSGQPPTSRHSVKELFHRARTSVRQLPFQAAGDRLREDRYDDRTGTIV